MLNDVRRELRPNQRNSARLPLIISQHLQVTALILSKVDGVVEILLMVAIIPMLVQSLPFRQLSHVDSQIR